MQLLVKVIKVSQDARERCSIIHYLQFMAQGIPASKSAKTNVNGNGDA